MVRDAQAIQGKFEATADGAPWTLSKQSNDSVLLSVQAKEWGIALIATLPIVAIVIAKLWGGVGVETLTRDTSAVLSGSPFAGLLSQLGGMIWSSAATLWLAMTVLTRRVDPAVSRFALAMATLTTYLGLDDMFLLHEAVFPEMMGIPEKVVLASIAAASCACAFVFRHRLAGHRPALFALAVGLLASSVLLDMLDGQKVIPIYSIAMLAEDGLKWLGICSWCAYAFSTLRRSVGQPGLR